MPMFDGQHNDKPVVNTATQQSWVINANISKEKQQATKEFLAYLCSDEVLRMFTSKTGETLVYDYALSEAELNNMTDFSRCCYQMKNDTEHVDILRHELLKKVSPINYATTKNANTFVGVVNGITYTSLYASLDRNSSEDVFNSIKNYYSAAQWAEYCTRARGQGFTL